MPDRHLCEAPRCAIRGQHAPDCGTDGCVGCLPRVAVDGLRLCGMHVDNLARDIDACPALHADLALVLAASERPGERVSGGLGGSLSLNERATVARHAVRHVLVSWALLVASERGVSVPARVITWTEVQERPSPEFIGPMPLVELSRHEEPTVRLIAVMLGRHVQWLSAHPAAGECADGFAERVAEARRVAYPTGARVFVVGPCPAQGDDGRCEGQIRAVLRRVDALLPSELLCSDNDEHRWGAGMWLRLGRQMRAMEAA